MAEPLQSREDLIQAVRRELTTERGYGVLTQVSSAVTVALYTRDSPSGLFLSTVRELRGRHRITQQVLTREQERIVNGPAEAGGSNNHTTLLLSTPVTDEAACKALDALLAAWQEDTQVRAKPAPAGLLWEQHAITALLVATDLTTPGLRLIEELRHSDGTRLRLCQTQTRVGNCPSFNVHTHRGSPVLVTLYMPSGKLKLQASICLHRDEMAAVVRTVLDELHTAHPYGPELQAFSFRDNVNFNRREEIYGMTSIDDIRERFRLAGPLLRVFEPPEHNGAARLEVTAALDNSDPAIYGGSINVFATPAPPNLAAGARAWLPKDADADADADADDCILPRPAALALRINLTGRVNPRVALDQTDAVALVARADPSLVRHPDFPVAVRTVLRERTTAEADALNRQRDRIRIADNLARIRAQLQTCGGTPAPLTALYQAPEYLPGHPADSDLCRFCFMCQSAYECARKTPRRVQCRCRGPQHCSLRSVSLESRPTPAGPDFRVYAERDGPLALALARLCAKTARPATPEPEPETQPGDRDRELPADAPDHCCTSCFQHNNRRRRGAEADGFIHANSRYILRLLFTGPLPLKQRNQKKLVKSCVRILTQTITLDNGELRFLCPPLFRPLLEALMLRWRQAPDALPPAPGRRSDAYRPLRGTHTRWEPHSLCLFRRWIARCHGQHWTDAGLWVWRQGFYQRQLGNPPDLQAPLEQITEAARALLCVPVQADTFVDILQRCGLREPFQTAQTAFHTLALPHGPNPSDDTDAHLPLVARCVARALAAAVAPDTAFPTIASLRTSSLADALFPQTPPAQWHPPCQAASNHLLARPAADWADCACDFPSLAEDILRTLQNQGTPADSDDAVRALNTARRLLQRIRRFDTNHPSVVPTIGFLAMFAVWYHQRHENTGQRHGPRKRRRRLC